MTAHHLYLIAPRGSASEVRRFYAEALGLAEVQTPSSLANASVLWFQAGAVTFHIGCPPAGTVGDGHTALAVDDVAAARAKLIAKGYAVDDHVIPMGYPRFYVRDPWGNQFEILPEVLP